MLKMMRKAPSGETNPEINEMARDIVSNGGYLKHAQTVDPQIKKNIEVRSQFNMPDTSPKSNISQVESSQSPTVKLTKYRWVQQKERKESIDVRVQHPDESLGGNASNRTEKSKKTVKARNRTKFTQASHVSLKVLKNMKYVAKLKRSPLLK